MMIWFSASWILTIFPNSVGLLALPFRITSVCGSNMLATLSVDRKSTRLNSSHLVISYAVFCLKKKINTITCRLLAGDADFDVVTRRGGTFQHSCPSSYNSGRRHVGGS